MKVVICTFCYSPSKCKQDLVWGIWNIFDYLLGYGGFLLGNGNRLSGEFWGCFSACSLQLIFVFLICSYFRMCYTSSFSKPSRKAAFHQTMQNMDLLYHANTFISNVLSGWHTLTHSTRWLGIVESSSSWEAKPIAQ